MKRGLQLASDLESRFKHEDDARRAELFRLNRVYGLPPESFETRLAALARSPEATREVRAAIAKQYRVRHPTILAYELLAHLLKHRFLDAIVTFNFDELLDQSLDDELGRNEYVRLVSDRDCFGVEADADASSYLPLYIKLHGTATEPESLRFTQDAYYQLPQELVGVVRKLLKSDFCAIVNVGSAMSGFDLHRLLRVPGELAIYDLSYTPLEENVRAEINSERQHPREDPFYTGEPRTDATFVIAAEGLKSTGPRRASDKLLEQLVQAIARRSGNGAQAKPLAKLVRFRSVTRHEAIADVLGAEATLSRWAKESDSDHREDYIEYLRQRTIVELALAGVKASGLAQLAWLAVDRCGTYYEAYRREAGRDAESWNDLREAAGLVENQWLPDVVEARPDLCCPGAGETSENRRWILREFSPRKLAEQIERTVGGSGKVTDSLVKVLTEFQSGAQIEIRSTDDRVCAKAFNAPLTLPTITSLSVYTQRLLWGLNPDDHVYISCETGEWLLEDEAVFHGLSKQEHVEVITAFDLKHADLNTKYAGKLTLACIDPWRHNRHMTIVCKGDRPKRAVYFASRLRSPLVTPIYLQRSEDAERLMRTFDLMRTQINETPPAAADESSG